MGDEQRDAALRRIEIALQRIEAAAKRGDDRGDQAAHAHLAARHDALRSESEAALAALDRIIAGETR